MANQYDIGFIWVPGHRDVTGNCIADEQETECGLSNSSSGGDRQGFHPFLRAGQFKKTEFLPICKQKICGKEQLSEVEVELVEMTDVGVPLN